MNLCINSVIATTEREVSPIPEGVSTALTDICVASIT